MNRGQTSGYTRARLFSKITLVRVVGTSLDKNKTARRTKTGLARTTRMINRYVMTVLKISQRVHGTKLKLMAVISRTRIRVIGGQIRLTAGLKMRHA